jgi:hypothetical protein
MTFFLLHASSVVGRLLFQGINGAGFRAVKVFWKNTTRSAARCGDFFKNPQGLTFTARQEAVNTFAAENNRPARGCYA